MKKVLKFIGKGILVLLILLLIILISLFISNRVMLGMEKPLRQPPAGQLVEVDGHNMSIYTEGKGGRTLVFLSGSGVPSPEMEYRTLYRQFSDEYRIAVVEKFGYGYSDITDDERTLETILRQDREALTKAGIEAPYILCPHSMSGLEALLWAQKYPEEVEAIIGLDMALPRTYDGIDTDNTGTDDVFNAAREMGIVRLFMTADQFPEALSQEDRDIYRAIALNNFCNKTGKSEALHIRAGVELIDSMPAPEMPMLLFVTDGTDTGMETEQWRSYPEEFAEGKDNVSLCMLDCGHMLNRFRPEEIAKEAKAFISELGK